MGDMRDETDLDYCPACGSALTGEFPVECPEHGPVNIDFWPSPWEGGEDAAAEFENPMDEFNEEMKRLNELAGVDVENPFAFFDDPGNESGEGMSDEEFVTGGWLGVDPDELDEGTEDGGVRDRINRLLERDG